MSDTATAGCRSAREASPPAVVEVPSGWLTAQPSPLAPDESLAQARLLPAPARLRSLDAALRTVLGLARLSPPAGIPVLAERPGVFGQSGGLVVPAVTGGGGCGDSAASLTASRLGDLAAVDALRTGRTDE